MSAQVFVSYSAEDRIAALPIIEAMGQAGLNVWHDPGGISQIKAAKEKESAECLVVLWSKAAAQSRWVQQEIHQAIKAWSSARLVLVVLDDAPLPIGLSDLPVISIRGESESGTQQLIERVRAIQAAQDIDAFAPLATRVGEESTPPAELLPQYAADAYDNLIDAAFAGLARPRSRRRWPGIVGALVAGLFAILAVIYLTRPRGVVPKAVEIFHATPWGSRLVILSLGIAIGAAAVWVWSVWKRRAFVRAEAQIPLELDRIVRSEQRQVPTESIRASQIFVSYSHHDRQTVEQLVEQVEQLGYGIWIDRAVAGSERYAAQIVRAIRRSRLIALMCSQNAFTSDHVIREVYVAGDLKKPFVIFQLDSTEFPDDIVYFISGFPRLPVATIDPERLRSELARLVAA